MCILSHDNRQNNLGKKIGELFAASTSLALSGDFKEWTTKSDDRCAQFHFHRKLHDLRLSGLQEKAFADAKKRIGTGIGDPC